MLGIIGGILCFGIQIYMESDKVPHVTEVAEAFEVKKEVKPEPKTVLIEVRVDWTPERIAQEIDKVFPDAPIMHDVMRCESGGNNDAYNPTNGSHDNGLFQISDLYHGPRVRALGLDVGDPADNIAFARILYDESGLQPWSASKDCWSK
ncbi:lyZ1 [Caudoviricetes sp.]|nr:lyZ1 [Caudoviricetes sp.]